jgi:hypothetical protein
MRKLGAVAEAVGRSMAGVMAPASMQREGLPDRLEFSARGAMR